MLSRRGSAETTGGFWEGAAVPLSRCPAVSAPGGAADFFMKIAGAIAMAIISRIAQTVRRSMIQFTASGDGIEPARMKRMTTDESAGGEPAAFERPIAGHRFERVLGARRGESTARRQGRRNAYLIAADEHGEEATGQLEEGHGSHGTENGVAPGQNLRLQGIEAGAIRFSPRLDDQIPGWLPLLNFPAPDFPQSAPQTIAGHRGRLKLGNDQSHPRLAR
jgi:hypothetical protein